MACKFYQLHDHTEKSLNDGMIKVKKLAKKLKEQGVDKFAVTEHGEMMDMPAAYLALKDEDIELIVGMETYVAPRKRSDKEKSEGDDANYHLVLLAENNEGYDNLKILASEAALNGFYYKPRVDKELLRQYHKGIIASSACLGGSINQFLLEDKYEEAKLEALEYLDIFGEGNFFLELQRHGLREQEQIEPMILRLSRETGIPLIATNDCHYLNKEDWEAHDILMAIQAGTTIDDTKRKIYTSHEFYVKSPEEMIHLFRDVPEAIENTVRIADRCHVELEFGVNKIPPFKLPNGYKGTENDFLREIVEGNAKIKYSGISEEVQERIDFELEVIERMGYVNYFLINWDFFRFCREGTYEIEDAPNTDWDPILTGPGRGSGAGSIVAYCTDITKIEPLQFNLLFERFLSPERVSMPDIDSDFEDTRRQEVIDYVVYKYGRECISQIITFGTLAARAVIRRVGKALDYPYAVCDKIAKSIPAEVGITIEKALAVNQSLRKAYDTDKSIKRLLDFSMQLEGLVTSCSTHAAGVLITDKKGVTAHVPLWENKGGIVAQFSKDYIEMLGLLKMDFLGLGTLGILGDAKRMIRANHGVNIDFDELYKLPTMEPLQLIRDGKTECLFQLNGAGMTAFMKELKPNSIEDIILGISMYRPGPMAEIPKLLYSKRNPNSITYEVDGLKYILDPTYGSIVYQEQCMQIVVAIAGFSKADSDNFRRIISKKKLKEMPKQREWFVHGRKKDDYDYEGHLRHYKADILGGVALGHSEEALNKLFDKMVDFAAYAFNKSHAAAYAFVGYLTAWFMKYYPVEFMAANLNAVQKNRAKIARYMNYARKELNLEILEPDINESVERFKATKDGKIMYTLSIKGASIDCLKRIVEERETNGKFENLIDFIARTRNFLDKKTYEGLIGSGALKCFGIIKSQHLAALDDFWDGCLKKTKDSEKNALKKNKDFNFEEILLGKIDGLLPNINEYPKDIDLRLEKEFLGMYLTDNPLYRYAYTIKTSNNFELSDVDYEVDEETGIIMMSNDSVRDRQKVRFVTILNDVAELTTKKKTLMARLELEDLTGIAGALIWPSTYDSIKSKLKKNEIYMCHGYLMVSSDEAPTIVVEDMELMEEMVTERAIISVDSKEDAVDIINYINDTDMAKGMTPVYLVYNNLQTLLTRNYWINLNHMNQKYENKIKIKIW